MTSEHFTSKSNPRQSTRTLKIEADGDFWKGEIKPKVRLKGYWLQLAGFIPGQRVHVTCVSPGVIELRAPDVAGATRQPPSAEPTGAL